MDKQKLAFSHSPSQRLNIFNIDFGRSSNNLKKSNAKTSSKSKPLPAISTPLLQQNDKLASPAVELVFTFLNNLPTQSISYKNVTYNYAFSGKTAIDTISNSFKMPNRDICTTISHKIAKNKISYPLLSTVQDSFYIDSDQVFYILTNEAFSYLNDSSLMLRNLSRRSKNLSHKNSQLSVLSKSNTMTDCYHGDASGIAMTTPSNYSQLTPRMEMRIMKMKPKSSSEAPKIPESSTQRRSDTPDSFEYALDKINIPQLELSSALKNYLTEDKSSDSLGSYHEFNNSRNNSILSSSKMLSNLDLNFGSGFKIDLEKDLFTFSESQSGSPSSDSEVINLENMVITSPNHLNLLEELEHDQRVSDTTIIDGQPQNASDYRKSLTNTESSSANQKSIYSIDLTPDKDVLHSFKDTQQTSTQEDEPLAGNIRPSLSRNQTNPTISKIDTDTSSPQYFDQTGYRANNTPTSYAGDAIRISPFDETKVFGDYPFKNFDTSLTKTLSRASTYSLSGAAVIKNNSAGVDISSNADVDVDINVDSDVESNINYNRSTGNTTLHSRKPSSMFKNKTSLEVPTENMVKKKSTQPSSKKSLLKQFGRSANDLKSLWTNSRTSKDDYEISNPTTLPVTSMSRSVSYEPRRPMLWSHTVPRDELSNFSSNVIRWQESIYETIETEKDYVSDMKLIDKIYIGPLIQSGCIPNEHIDEFIKRLFLNYDELIDMNSLLAEELTRRQLQYSGKPLPNIGDIFIKWSQNLDPFIKYSIGIQLAQVALEAEMHDNENFAKFIYSTEINELSRKLPIQSFLSRPTARFAKYPLLIKSILKSIPKNGYESEIANLELVSERVKSALDRINELNGNQVKRLRLLRLTTQIRTTAEEGEILDISNENRELLLEDDFYRADGSVVHGFLFDNCFILATKKKVEHAKGITEYIIEKGPLPLMLLGVSSEFGKENDLIHPLIPKKIGFGRLPIIITKSAVAQNAIQPSTQCQSPDSNLNTQTNSGYSQSGYISGTNNNSVYNNKPASHHSAAIFSATSHTSNVLMNSNNNLKPGRMDAIASSVPITFGMISKLGWELTLWAASANNRDLWIECVNSRVTMLNDQASEKLSFDLLSRNFHVGFEALCMVEYVSFAKTTMRMIGTTDGIYICQSNNIRSINKVCSLPNVTNIAVLNDYNIVVVLYEKTVVAIPLSDLENPANWNLYNRGTKLASSVAYFDTGLYFDAPLIVLMKYRHNKSYYKCLLPIKYDTANEIENSSSPLVYQNTQSGLKVAHEFCIPGLSSKVFFFKRKLCIANGNCFDVIDLTNKVITQSLPRNIKSIPGSSAMAIYRVSRLFLLCFEDYAIYIDRMGQQVFPDLVIHYLVKPVQFAFVYPNYLIAVGKEFIEIRYIDTGDLFVILRIPGIKCLDHTSHPLTYTPHKSISSKKKSVTLSMKSRYLPKSVKMVDIHDGQESIISYESSAGADQQLRSSNSRDRRGSSNSTTTTTTTDDDEDFGDRRKFESGARSSNDAELGLEGSVPLGRVSHPISDARKRLSKLSNGQIRTSKVLLPGSSRPPSSKSSTSKYGLSAEPSSEQNQLQSQYQYQNQYFSHHHKQSNSTSSNADSGNFSNYFNQRSSQSQSQSMYQNQQQQQQQGQNQVQLRPQTQTQTQTQGHGQASMPMRPGYKYNHYSFATSNNSVSIAVTEYHSDHVIVELILP